MIRDVYPLQLALPDGRRADLVPGSRPARYTIDGQASDIDVTIPDDLAATGWYWSGSFFYQPWPERDDGPGVAICTATYPPQGYAVDDRGTVFDAARRLDAKRIEVRTMLEARPAKKSKTRKAMPAVAEPEQMELFV